MIDEGKDSDFFFGRVSLQFFYKGIGFLNLSASATPHFQVLEFAWSATASNYMPPPSQTNVPKRKHTLAELQKELDNYVSLRLIKRLHISK